MPFFGKRTIKRMLTTVATTALGAGLLVGLSPTQGGASSHREAPLVAADPQVDSTDLYAFVTPAPAATSARRLNIITNWIPFEEPAGGPNFYSFAPGAHYDVNIDNDGDVQPDIIYRWVFSNHYRNPNTFLYNTGQVTSLTDPDLNFYQTYKLVRIDTGAETRDTLVANGRVVPSDVGDASMPDYRRLFDAGTHHAGTGALTWAGQADDSFFLDLRVFDLLYGLNFSEAGDDTLAGFNVNSIALQVPLNDVAQSHNATRNPVVGIWTTVERQSIRVQDSEGSQSFFGQPVQVSRLGMPLVNEVVIPVGQKDRFSASQPKDDPQFLQYVVDPELPHIVNAVYGFDVPDCHDGPPITRECDLVPVFLTGVPGLNTLALNKDNKGVSPGEMLRINMSIPPCTSGCSRLGVLGNDNAGFPNGRRLSDDIIDIALRVTEGVLIPLFSNNGHYDSRANGLSDGVNANDEPFLSRFPYIGIPWSGSDPDPHGSSVLRR